MFWLDIALRGCTELGDDPHVLLRRYVRTGGTSGSVACLDATPLVLVRPRLKDNTAIKCQKTVNNGVAYTDYSANVVDNSAATGATLDSLDTLANGDWIVIGGPVPFSGAAIDMDAALVNAVASTITVAYWNGAAWVPLSNVTDGTEKGGACFNADGQITWSIPSDWAAVAVNSITAYWVKISVSAALSASVEIEEIDLLMPIKMMVESPLARGADATIMLESQGAAVTGTIAVAATTQVAWQ